MVIGQRRLERTIWLRGSVYVFVISLMLFIGHEYALSRMPLQGLPPLAERIQGIEQRIDPDDFCFAVLGDNKNDKAVFPAALGAINDDPEISFVVHTGDMVKAPVKSLFQDFLKTVRACLEKPFLICPGNHDDGREDSPMYERAFGQKQYVVSIGGTCLVFADTQRLSFGTGQGWLRRALDQNRQSRSIIVFMHMPPCDPRGGDHHHALRLAVAERLLSLFKEYHVNHVYTGHIHGYWAGDWDMIPYTITAAAGARLYSKDPAHGFYHYLKVRVKDGRIQQVVKPVKNTSFAKLSNVFLYYIQVEHLKTGLIAVMICSGMVSVWLWIRQYIQKRVCP